MEHVNILMGRMHPILAGILKDVIGRRPQSVIVAEDIGPESIVETVREKRPNVVILAASASLQKEDFQSILCGGGARVRVITLDSDHKSARRHELVPDIVTLSDISPESLGDAIFSNLSPQWAEGHGRSWPSKEDYDS